MTTTPQRTAFNAGLADLKLEKASVTVSGLNQAVAMALSFTAKSPDAAPTATRITSSGIFGMGPALEQTQTKTNTALWALLQPEIGETNGDEQNLCATYWSCIPDHPSKSTATHRQTPFHRPIINFRTSPHVTTEPSSNKPIRVCNITNDKRHSI